MHIKLQCPSQSGTNKKKTTYLKCFPENIKQNDFIIQSLVPLHLVGACDFLDNCQEQRECRDDTKEDVGRELCCFMEKNMSWSEAGAMFSDCDLTADATRFLRRGGERERQAVWMPTSSLTDNNFLTTLHEKKGPIQKSGGTRKQRHESQAEASTPIAIPCRVQLSP